MAASAENKAIREGASCKREREDFQIGKYWLAIAKNIYPYPLSFSHSFPPGDSILDSLERERETERAIKSPRTAAAIDVVVAPVPTGKN